jgi:hypothetical protein
MDTNDFLGSFAQENVSFSTQIVKTAVVGQNFWTALIFVENDRYVTADTEHGWEDCPGLPSCKVLVVNADNYSEFTSGLLASWLYDLFCNGFTGNCILAAPAGKDAPDIEAYEPVTPAEGANPQAEGWYELNVGTYVLSEDTTVTAGKTYYEKHVTPGFVAAMEEAYNILKPYAYHKTVCAGSGTEPPASYAISLAKKCMQDEYLSGAPMLPQSDPTLATGLYPALKAANADAFMGWHSDSTRNPALYSLGLALAVYNGSGTPVGNALDMTASSNITASNGGQNPTSAQKSILKGAWIQYFKTVGDNTGNVAAETDKTINGKVYAAYWILAYITYMTKVRIAQLITQRNFFKNAGNYGTIVQVLKDVISIFGKAGVLTAIDVSAPSYANLPEAADDQIIIPNAWSASYVNHLRKVTITGTLYIGG